MPDTPLPTSEDLGYEIIDSIPAPKVNPKMMPDSEEGGFFVGILEGIKNAFLSLTKEEEGSPLATLLLFTNRVKEIFETLSTDLVGESIIPDMMTDIFNAFEIGLGDSLDEVTTFVSDTISAFEELATELIGESIVPEMLEKITKRFKDTLDYLSNNIIQPFISKSILSFERLNSTMERTIELLQELGALGTLSGTGIPQPTAAPGTQQPGSKSVVNNITINSVTRPQSAPVIRDDILAVLYALSVG